MRFGVESIQHYSPYGARGINEQTMIVITPMVANAVEDALGIRRKRILISSSEPDLSRDY